MYGTVYTCNTRHSPVERRSSIPKDLIVPSRRKWLIFYVYQTSSRFYARFQREADYIDQWEMAPVTYLRCSFDNISSLKIVIINLNILDFSAVTSWQYHHDTFVSSTVCPTPGPTDTTVVLAPGEAISSVLAGAYAGKVIVWFKSRCTHWKWTTSEALSAMQSTAVAVGPGIERTGERSKLAEERSNSFNELQSAFFNWPKMAADSPFIFQNFIRLSCWNRA